MNYYASWQRSSVPKWAVATLGGAFTVIILVCAVMIVHLVRPARRAPLPIVAAAVAPAPAPAKAAAPATVAATPPAAVAALAPAAAATPASQPVAASAPAVKKHSAHPHKRAILAKHDGKSGRSAKSDLDRLLGL